MINTPAIDVPPLETWNVVGVIVFGFTDSLTVAVVVGRVLIPVAALIGSSCSTTGGKRSATLLGH